jgi:hypothetical protein
MTNLEKMQELRLEIKRLDGIFSELNGVESVKGNSKKNDKDMIDLIIYQTSLVEKEMNLLMEKAKLDVEIGEHNTEINVDKEGVSKLKEIYGDLLKRLKTRTSKESVKSIFEEDEDEENTIVTEMYNKRKKDASDIQEFLIKNGLEK